jgi:hypothetical protein
MNSLLYLGIEMHRKHDLHSIPMKIGEPLYRVADLLQANSKAFAAMGGNEHELRRRIEPACKGSVRQNAVIGTPGYILKGIDHRISGHVNFASADTLLQEVLPGALRRREMQVGDMTGQPAIQLLRKRIPLIERAESSFHMADWNMVVVCCQ